MLKTYLKKKVSNFIGHLLTEENISKRLYNNYPLWNGYTKHFKNIGSDSYVIAPFYLLNPEFISIGYNFSALQNLRLEAYTSYRKQAFVPDLSIGDNVCFNSDVHIGCINKIHIGNNVLLASRVYISDHSHGEISKSATQLPPIQRPLISKGPVIIGDNVWIGEGVSILPNVVIGENTIIGANAVVTKSFPADSVIAGNPAKLIKVLS